MGGAFVFRARLGRGISAGRLEPGARRQGEVLRARGGAASVARFDARFGAGLLATVPTEPGTYVFRDAGGQVLYVGKAGDLRARLRQYRHASAGPRGRRMRGIVAEAHTLTWEVASSLLAAGLRELALIQALRPTLNIAGAFAGRYPFWGLRREPDGTVLFCHTAHPDSAPGFALSGAWRSRALSEAAFAALMRLLSLLGHPETGRKARGSGRGKTPEREALAELHGRVVRFRQLPGPLIDALPAALREAADEWVVDLSLDLLERPAARRRAEAVAADLAILSAFWRDEVTPLRAACGAVGLEAWPVPQAARDPLLLEARALGVVAAPARPPRRGKRRDRAAAAPRKRFTRSRQRPRGGRGRRGPG